jgi:biopolymer transport protein ExbD
VVEATVTLFAQADGSFRVNGTVVLRENLAAALAEIGAATPGAKVTYSRDPQAPDDSVIVVHNAAKAAKLGPLSFAQ